ncbi:hypothetical protein V6N13_018409 [Hibiscus sabdariffa]|uniref:Uncharacterized protein n=1 Tax=Hibiscus sabdariffa TaxID=183260 RepID=A0ABR2EM40_9ROSI
MQLRNEVHKDKFIARNRKTAHRVIEAELFLGPVKQMQKRRMVQVWNRNDESCLLDFSNINHNVAFQHIGRVP